MKLAFVINRLETEKGEFTTTRLSRIGSARGHDIALIELGDFIYDASGSICAMATRIGKTDIADDDAFIEEIQDQPREGTHLPRRLRHRHAALRSRR